MKSRFLASTTVVLALLLGFASSNLLAQISDASTVDFEISNFLGSTMQSWRTSTNATTPEDTVGGKVAWRVTWDASNQASGLTKYTVTFPEGTVTNEDSLKDSGIQIKYTTAGQAGVITNIIPASDIEVVQSNPIGGWSSSVAPSVRITSNRNISTGTKFQLEFLKGLWNSKSVMGTNKYTYDAVGDRQPNMQISLVNSDDANTTYKDNSSFYVSNGRADGVNYNTGITSIISGSYLPSGDSLIVVDRFGNYVPDFFSTTNDSMLITVSSVSSIGTWTSALTTDLNAASPTTKFGGVLATQYADTSYFTPVIGSANMFKIRGNATWYSANTIHSWDGFDKTTLAGPFLAVDVNTGTAAAQNQDKNVIPIYLGNTFTSGHTATTHDPYGMGLKFNLASSPSVATGDTVSITVYVGSRTAAKQSSGTVLGVAASHMTVIKRVLSAGTEGRKINSLTFSTKPANGLTYDYGKLAENASVKLTIKNVFGDNFDGSNVGSSSIDSIGIMFRYTNWGGYNGTDSISMANTSKTSILQGGGTVNSKYSHPKARLLKGGNSGTFTDFSDAPYGTVLTGAAATAGVVDLTGALYYGLASHAIGDSIYVVAYAMHNTAARDSFLIKVEPSAPVAFDLDTLTANLNTVNAAGQVVKDAAIPLAMPIMALDTAYNYVSNLDLKYNATNKYLDKIATASTGSVKAIEFMVDGRAPLGYESKTVTDSIRTLADQSGSNAGARVKADSAAIFNYTEARADSSKLNLGGLGSNPMSLKFKYLGNHVINMKWKPGTVGTAALSAAERTIDLGLFKLTATQQTPSSNDSVITITKISAPDTVDNVAPMEFKFTLPAGNGVSPNTADSLIYVKFPGLTSPAGVPSGITADSVRVSQDGSTYYAATAVMQGASNKDSLAIVPSVPYSATSNQIVYLKIYGFKNPTKSDSSYAVKVATTASPIWATLNNLWTPTDGNLGMIKIVDDSTNTASYTSKTLSSLKAASAMTITAGASAYAKVILGDRYGNILNQSATSTRRWVAKTADSTATGKSATIAQIYDGTAQTTSGNRMYDSLTVKVDTLKNSTAKYGMIDSLKITPAAAGSYYLVLMDSSYAMAKDSVMLTVKTGTLGSLTLVSPKGKQASSKSTMIDSVLTVKLADSQGNAVSDTVVTFAVASGSGTFPDSNGVAVAVPNDTIWVAANAMGMATATLMTGASDSVAVKASVVNTGISAVYFSATTTIPAVKGPSTFTFVSVPDSLTPDTSSTHKVIVTVKDGDALKRIALVTYTTMLTLDSDNMFMMAATTDTMWVTDTVSGSWTSKTDTMWIAKKPLGSYVMYNIVAVDAQDSVTTSASNVMVIAPKRGKSKLSTDKVNVADIMRLVYLFVQPIPITPTMVDYFGLDLDQDGMFTGDKDLIQELKIWNGTSTLAAAGEQQQSVSAKLALSMKEVDKANANLQVELDNSGALNLAIFRVKYDPKLYALGEVSRTERIDNNLQVVTSDNKTEGILTVAIINLSGHSIAKGSGAILSIPVEALNGKFDGTGEISLLNANFDEGVQTDLSKEALSPKATLPKAYALGQNFPNPFNPSTTIAYDIPDGKEVQVRLNIYNIRGQLVRTLVNEVKSEGSYQIQWDGTNSNGQTVSSGVYFYRIQAGDFNQTRKMVILK